MAGSSTRVGVGLALLLATACSSSPPQARTPRPALTATTPTATAPTATTPTATAPTAPPPAPTSGRSPLQNDALTLAFGGDVHFARQLAPLLRDPAGLAELRPYLARADVAMVNLETAITERGSPAAKTYHFRSSPAALDVLAGAGVDVVTMANNHAADYGRVGLADTLTARDDSPVPVVGLGRDEADAYAPAVLTVRGRRVAVLGATQVPDWTARTHAARGDRPGVALSIDPTRLVRAVRAARERADVVVVYLHWGTDYTGCPDAAQRRTSRALAAAGADVVVGTHAHQVQGGGWLDRTYVGYGLGNFVWYSRNSPTQAATGVLTLTLSGRHVVKERWQPLEVSADGVPRRAGPRREQQLVAERERSRRCTGLSAAPLTASGAR